ncbi:S-layer homology domain-containing protein [Chakrabartyella piscis]|uniref:S-layer homology domain-containing protein n=1 Tax=Chakrabartyella piscis TaxID=2918914 RepID=UPI00295864F2|nr:S-layer homology domain-containing protein [Chakrabartyella piscis]
MKKILKKTIAVASCLAMLLPNVAFAAENQYVTVDFWHAVSDQASMGNLATDNNEFALYLADENILQMGTNPVDVSGFQSGVVEILVDTTGDGDYKAVDVISRGMVETGTKNDGVNHEVNFINKCEFELPSYIKKSGVEYIPIQISVPHTPMDVVVGEGYLDARIQLDWTQVKSTSDTDLVVDASISSGTVNAVGVVDEATGIMVAGDSTVVHSESYLEVTTITSGSDYTLAKNAVGTDDFDLYEIQMVLNGVDQVPDGALEITFPYSSDIELYRISDTGTKTVLRGLYKDGEYKISTRQMGLFAVVGGTNMYTPATTETVETPVTTTSTTAFTDMTSHWAKDNVAKAVELGLFSGITETTFAPNDSMTNAMAISVLYRVAGTPDVTTTETQWYAKAVAWGLQEGIVGGYNDFVPMDSITRQELATMLYRYELTQGGGTEKVDLSSFSDVNSIATWAADAFSWANAKGIINGTTATTLAPTEGATRAQVATMFVSYTK